MAYTTFGQLKGLSYRSNWDNKIQQDAAQTGQDIDYMKYTYGKKKAEQDEKKDEIRYWQDKLNFEDIGIPHLGKMYEQFAAQKAAEIGQYALQNKQLLYADPSKQAELRVKMHGLKNNGIVIANKLALADKAKMDAFFEKNKELAESEWGKQKLKEWDTFINTGRVDGKTATNSDEIQLFKFEPKGSVNWAEVFKKAGDKVGDEYGWKGRDALGNVFAGYTGKETLINEEKLTDNAISLMETQEYIPGLKQMYEEAKVNYPHILQMYPTQLDFVKAQIKAKTRREFDMTQTHVPGSYGGGREPQHKPNRFLEDIGKPFYQGKKDGTYKGPTVFLQGDFNGKNLNTSSSDLFQLEGDANGNYTPKNANNAYMSNEVYFNLSPGSSMGTSKVNGEPLPIANIGQKDPSNTEVHNYLKNTTGKWIAVDDPAGGRMALATFTGMRKIEKTFLQTPQAINAYMKAKAENRLFTDGNGDIYIQETYGKVVDFNEGTANAYNENNPMPNTAPFDYSVFEKVTKGQNDSNPKVATSTKELPD